MLASICCAHDVLGNFQAVSSVRRRSRRGVSAGARITCIAASPRNSRSNVGIRVGDGSSQTFPIQTAHTFLVYSSQTP
jgi:hypothetical protein